MQNTGILFALVAGVTGLSSVGCGTTMPPKELADARASYTSAASGPAAQESPAQLHSAKTALDEAERAFADDGDKPVTRDKAYIAQRKAELADATAQTQLALKTKTAADQEAQAVIASKLNRAQGDLANAQGNLSKTQEQLAQEKLARDAAEKKAAQALADLSKIAQVKQETRGMVITLSGSVLFETDKSALLPTANQKLNDVADALIKGNPDANITIEGHTDSQGTRDHNMVLSQQRAESVKAQLVSRGVAADRIKTVGVGPDRPVADNKSPEGRANNRRVEIVVEGAAGGNSGPSSTKPVK